MHDWGAVGLLTAQRMPERIARVVIINAVPFLPGYQWHRTARIWRTRLLGELSIGMTVRFTLRQLTRESNVTPGPLPDEWIEKRWRTSTRAPGARSCACTAARRRRSSRRPAPISASWTYPRS